MANTPEPYAFGDNGGDVGTGLVVTSAHEEVAAYDELPPALRLELRQAPHKWSALQIRDYLEQGYGVEAVLVTMRQQNKDLMAKFITPD